MTCASECMPPCSPRSTQAAGAVASRGPCGITPVIGGPPRRLSAAQRVAPQPPHDEPGQREPVGRVGRERAVALDLADQPRRGERRGERGARCPSANATRTSRRQPAPPQPRRPSAPVAARISGSATWRESTFASSRVKRRAARGGERRAVARDAGHERARLRRAPSASASRAAGLLARALLRRAVGEPPSRARRATSPAAIVAGRAEPPLDRALEQERERAGGRERQHEQREPPAVEPARRLADLAAQPDQQRRGGAGVQRDLERLAQLGVELARSASRRATARARRGRRRRSAAARPGPCSSAERERLAQRQLAGAGAHARRRLRARALRRSRRRRTTQVDDGRRRSARRPRSRRSAGCPSSPPSCSPTCLPMNASAKTHGRQPSER